MIRTLKVEGTEYLVLSYFIDCIADPPQRKSIQPSESIDCLRVING